MRRTKKQAKVLRRKSAVTRGRTEVDAILAGTSDGAIPTAVVVTPVSEWISSRAELKRALAAPGSTVTLVKARRKVNDAYVDRDDAIGLGVTKTVGPDHVLDDGSEISTAGDWRFEDGVATLHTDAAELVYRIAPAAFTKTDAVFHESRGEVVREARAGYAQSVSKSVDTAAADFAGVAQLQEAMTESTSASRMALRTLDGAQASTREVSFDTWRTMASDADPAVPQAQVREGQAWVSAIDRLIEKRKAAIGKWTARKIKAPEGLRTDVDVLKDLRVRVARGVRAVEREVNAVGKLD